MKTNTRRLSLSDGPSFQLLSTTGMDIALKQYRRSYLVDPIETFDVFYDDYQGVVIEDIKSGKLTAAGLIQYQDIRIDQQISQTAFLGNLIIPTKYKWFGMHKVLLDELLAKATNHTDNQHTILTYLQPGSKLALTGDWTSQILTNKVNLFPVQMSPKKPDLPSGYYIGPIQEDDIQQVSDLLNDFYKDFNFYSPKTLQSLKDWLEKCVENTLINHYWVVKDENHNLLAGIGLSEVFQLRQTHLNRMPITKTLNLFLNLIPAKGTINELAASMFWHLPNQEKAAKYLWESIRFEWRNQANTLLIYLDPKNPLCEIVGPNMWRAKSGLNIALKNELPIDEDKLIYTAPL